MLGSQRLASWIDRFGFGSKTGIDFPGETPGHRPAARAVVGLDDRQRADRPGIAVTPVQMAAAYAAVANGGVWLQPHLVDHVAGGARPRTSTRRRIVWPDIADEVKTMLRTSSRRDTGTRPRCPATTVAGKTGTARSRTRDGGYSTSNYVASFVGIVPATKPRLVILVTVDEPRGAIWGGVVAAPAFQRIAQFALQYLEVRPQPDDPDSSRRPPGSGPPKPPPRYERTAASARA